MFHEIWSISSVIKQPEASQEGPSPQGVSYNLFHAGSVFCSELGGGTAAGEFYRQGNQNDAARGKVNVATLVDRRLLTITEI
jgi:hypothetical protein